MSNRQDDPFIQRERTHLQYGLSSSALLSNLAIERGEGVWLYDIHGNRYMDLFAGAAIASLGHAHPLFLHSVHEQLDDLIVSSYTSPIRSYYVAALADTLPKSLNQVSFFSTGSEANEAALLMARTYTRKFEVISFWGGYHGKTGGTISLSDRKWGGSGIPPFPGILRVPYPDTYRRVVPIQDDSRYLEWCITFLKQTIETSSSQSIAAIIVESLQGTSGNVIPVSGFLQAIRKLCHDIGAIFILDEVITGFGRTGSMFSFEQETAIPDILVIGKGMGNGLPISAIVTTEQIASTPPLSLPSGMSSSFGGNPLSIAAAHATLTIIKQEKLVENAQIVGKYWLDLLHNELSDFAFVGNIRGRGLMIGIELVKDRVTKEPLEAALIKQLFFKGLEHGLIAGLQSPHIRLNPPLIFTKEDANWATEKIKACFNWLKEQIAVA